jgi:hypothetical protein
LYLARNYFASTYGDVVGFLLSCLMIMVIFKHHNHCIQLHAIQMNLLKTNDFTGSFQKWPEHQKVYVGSKEEYSEGN